MKAASVVALLAAASGGAAQSSSLQPAVSAPCVALNEAVMADARKGRLAEAEKMLSVSEAGDLCSGMVLGNMAAHLWFSGRLKEGERLAVTRHAGETISAGPPGPPASSTDPGIDAVRPGEHR